MVGAVRAANGPVVDATKAAAVMSARHPTGKGPRIATLGVQPHAKAVSAASGEDPWKAISCAQ